MSRRIAIVLFNLGGPDNLGAVRPFLFNLFADPAIIRLPNPLRIGLAWAIAKKRSRVAKDIYAEIGGTSPLLPNTEAQARAVEAALADLGEARAFIAMRYWHPLSQETAMLVKDFSPDEVILLPLYPQFSTTTTASSLRAWRDACRIARLDAPTRVVCCYPTEDRFIAAMAAGLRAAHAEAARHGRPRVLFSAHGLPEKIVKTGDPYQWQCDRTAAALAEASGIPDLDWVSTYQSRVGRLRWIEPSTEAVIHEVALARRPIVVVPIAFVSEHSETLVELDIEYRKLADEVGAPFYLRVPTVGADEAFIAGLADLVRASHRRGTLCEGGDGGRTCPAAFSGCLSAMTTGADPTTWPGAGAPAGGTVDEVNSQREGKTMRRLNQPVYLGSVLTAMALCIAPAHSRDLEQVKPVFEHVIPNVDGKSLVAVVVTYPPGGKSPSHHHAPSAFIYAYVLSGAIRSQVGDEPARVYQAGESFFELPGSHHRISENASDKEPASLLAVVVVDSKDKPLTTPDQK